MKITINDDLKSGWILDGDYSDGDTVTVYGVRFEIGLDYGDGHGATLTAVAIDKYPHHEMIDDCEILEPRQMLAGDYDWLAGGSLSDEVGEDTLITIHADNTYTIGEYDGNQYGESLI